MGNVFSKKLLQGKDVEGVKSRRILFLCQFFMDPSDYYGAPINKVLHFIRSVGLIKG
jgi:hypothetical protein